MSNVAAVHTGRSVLVDMATRYGMEPAPFEATLRATVVPKDCSREQFAAFLLVAKEYGLNPVLKEIYAFPAKGGGIQPIVSVDGWMNLINSHPNMDGLEFDDHHDDKGEITAITARIWRKDRSHPIVVTEYMAECKRSTEPWKQWPRRMLRHKAAIQCARYAFGFAGIVDPDEAERMGADTSKMRDVTPPAAPTPPPAPKAITPKPTLRPTPASTGGAEANSTGDTPLDPDTGEVIEEAALLPATESATLRSGLIKRLHAVKTTADIEAWAANHKAAILTLQPDDRQLIQDEWSAREAELFEREQTTAESDATGA